MTNELAIRILTGDVLGTTEQTQEAITMAVRALSLPSKQSEIIRCKDCKWKQGAECVRFAEIRPFPNDFCSRAERREE